MVVNVGGWGKPLIAITAVALFISAALGLLHLSRDYQTSKVDRSKAMQVTKQVDAEQIAPVAANDFFVEYRLERDRLRSERSDILREVIKSSNNDDARQKAQDAVLRMVNEEQREAEVENLIRARGFADALVVMRDNSVNAVIKTQNLNRDEVLQVADIISRVTGVKPEDITISVKQ